MIDVREDVGRHNAVDKLVGARVLAGEPAATGLGLFVSGRGSIEMVQKAWAAGFTTLLSVSAPTALAVHAARRAGLTLVGFVRDGEFNVYSPSGRRRRPGADPPPAQTVALIDMRIENGLGVLHLFARPTPQLDREAVVAAVKRAQEADAQVLTASLLGHKADIAVMALHRDWTVLRGLQTSLRNAGLDIVASYVSLTEVSEYAKGMPEHMLQCPPLSGAAAGGQAGVLLLPDEQTARARRPTGSPRRTTTATR